MTVTITTGKNKRRKTNNRKTNKKKKKTPSVATITTKYTSPKACSPISKADMRGGNFSTCYTYEALLDIANAYNKTAPDNDRIRIVKGKKALWTAIKNKMDRMSDCEGEWCWVKQPLQIPDDKRRRLVSTFKPPIPKGKYDWLSTEDIDHVINQYKPLHPELYFMGTWPMDFEKLHPKFREFDPIELERQKITKVALVLNEDTSDQPGSHWVGLFMDLPKRQVNFFDSLGDKPKAPVIEWIQRINKNQKNSNSMNSNSMNSNPSFQLLWNPHRHQYANSECGVYTINFLIKRIEDVPFKTIVNNQIRDEAMNKKRADFFNPFDKYDNR